MKHTKLTAFAFVIAAIAGTAAVSANAAVITFQTGQSFAGTQATAEGYRTAVEAAVAGSSLGTKVLTTYDIVSNQSLFGNSNSNLAYKSDIVFGLDAAGTYSFRAGVDFGKGGALFLDGVAVDVKSNDMWWAHNYANTDSIFQVSNQALLAGNHTLTLYGLEGCCDGGQQVQFSANGAAFQSFSVQTLAPVPEPETYAMMLGGIAMIGAVARRRRQRQA